MVFEAFPSDYLSVPGDKNGGPGVFMEETEWIVVMGRSDSSAEMQSGGAGGSKVDKENTNGQAPNGSSS